MDLKKLFDLQRELDSRISKEHHLEEESLFSQKALALQVEFGELANETRCFKYWSNKKPSPKNIIIEEYVDCLHFILSIGLDKNFENVELSRSCSINKTTDQFLDLFIDINDFLICSSIDHYITLFEDFLSLGLNLGFTDKEIEDAYLNKNYINHQRQATGY
jgi:dimeric dUTPase (all-alpha-NTP-PPase superfamily)